MKKAGFLIMALLCCLCTIASGQAAFTFKTPTGLSVCADTALLHLKVTNTSSSDTLKSAKLTYRMPAGFRYLKSSVSGTGVSESNITTIGAPVFSVPNLKPGDSVKLTLKAVADCGIINFINGGGTLKNFALLSHTKGKDSALSAAYSVNIPTLNISKITNQSFVGSPGDTFSRRITFTNTADGKITGFTFIIVRSKDVQIDSFKGKKPVISGDTLKITFTDKDFKTIGNKDNFLDKNETLVLQQYLKITGCSSLTEKYYASWGCNSKICETYSTTAGVVINQIYPDLTVTPGYYQSTCLSKVLDNRQKLTIKNKGTGPAYNVVVDVFQTIYYPGGYYDTVQSRIDEKSLKIKYGTGSASSTTADTIYKTTAKPCLSFNNPKGRFIKIIPLLKAGETVELSWDVYSCCTVNGYVNTWGYKVDYTEQCKAKTYTTGLQGANYRRYQNFTDHQASTKDLIVNDTVPFAMMSTGYNELFPQGSKARLLYEITLPAGVNVKTSGIQLKHYTGSPSWKPSSASISGSKVNLIFSFPMPSGFDLSNSYLDMNLGVDTTGGKGKCGDVKDILLRVRYTADDTCAACTQILLQDTFEVKFNCNNPKRIGLQNLSVAVQRTSFGLADNNDDGKPDASGSLNFSKIAADRVMYGDTFKVDFKGIVRVKGTPSIWHFGIADIKFSEDYFEPIGFEVRIVDSTNGKTYTCDQIPYYEKNGGSYRFFFHYDSLKTRGCSTSIASGYRYRSGDSVQIKILYKVITNNYGIKKVTVNNLFFFGGNPNPTKLRDFYYVDNFPGYINVVGYYHTQYGYPLTAHHGCKTVDLMQSFYLSIGPCCSNYYGGNMFPYEYRYWSHASRFKTVLPKGYEYVSALLYYYPTEGSGKYGYYTSAVQLSEQVGDTLIFDVDSLYKPNGGSWQYSDDGYAGTMVVTTRATCEAVQDVNQTVTQYQTYTQDSKLSGAAALTFTNYTGAKWEKPNIVIQPALQTVNTFTDTFSWLVYISNLHNSADIEKAWLAFSSNSGKITVNDVSTTSASKYNENNGIYELQSLKGGQTKILKINANIKTCSRDSIKLIFGWNCDDYPDSLSGYKCPTDSLMLFAEPKPPAVQIKSISAQDSMYLCDTAKYILEITNTKTGYAKESEVEIKLVPGLKPAKGTSYLEYPVGSTPVKIANPDSLNPYLFRYKATDISKKIDSLGLAGISDTAYNKFRIHTGLVTDCDYISGSFAEFTANSYNRCSEPVNVSTTVSPALYLRGAVSPYLSLVSIRTKSINACGNGTELLVKMLNMGNGSTDSTDNIFITLPKGLSLDKNYFKGKKNAPQDSTREVLTFNGQTRVSWLLPEGIVSGDSVVFSVWLKPDSFLACAELPLFLQATTKKALTCISNNTICFVKIETGRLLQNIKIVKPVIGLDNFNAFSVNDSAGSEKLTVNIRLKNNGDTLKPGNGQVIRFYLDSDGNKKLSAADKLVGTDTIKTKINPGATVKISEKYSLAAGKNCALIAYWDSTGTNCACSPTQVYLDKIPFRNAGKDTAVCFGETIMIGEDSVKGYKYSWSPGNLVADSTKSNTTFTGANSSSSVQIKKLVLTTIRTGNCAVQDTISITSYPEFKIDPGYGKTICAGGTANLGGSPTAKGGSGTFTYLWSPKNALDNNTIANPKASPKETTWYKLTVTQNGCAKTDSVLVEVLPVPLVDAGNDKTICEGDTVNIGGSSVASGGKSPYSYQWSPSTGLSSATLTNPKANPSSTTNYILTVTDANGCKGYDTVTVTVNENPVADAGADKNICAGDSIKLGGTKSASGGISPYQYLWNPAFGLSDSVASNPYAKPNITTTYTLTVTDAKGCKSTSKVKVTVNNLPTADAGKNREICSGDTTIIGGNPTANGGSGTFTYSWSPKNALSSATVSNPKAYPQTTTTFTVKITDAKGCFVFDSVKITVNPLPVIEAGNNDTICEGDTIQLSAKAQSNYTYSWSPGKYMNDSTLLNPYINPPKNALFILTAKDAKGCVSKDTVNIFVRSRKALLPPSLACVKMLDSNKIIMNWDTVPGNIEFRNYSLYRINEAGKTELLSSINNRKATSYTDSTFTDAHAKQYRYFLTTWNKCGVEGKASDTIGTIILQAIKVGDKTLKFSWTAPYSKTLKYALEYDKVGGFKLLDSTSKTNYTIQNCDLNARFRISAELNNCLVNSNETGKIWLNDSTPPAVQQVHFATVKNWKQIELQFEPGDSADVKTYKIFRSVNDGSFSQIATANHSGKTIIYTDDNLATNKNIYTYKILAEDTCGNKADFTESHTPVLLQAKPGNYESQLNWKTYEGFPIDRQQLQRWENGSWKTIQTLGSSDTNFTDKPLKCDATKYYRIVSLSSDPAILSVSDSVLVTPFDTVKPQIPVVNYVSLETDNSVKISWKKVTDVDVVNYIVFRKNKNESAWQTIDTAGKTDTFTDHVSGLQNNVFEYAISALDSCAKNESQKSIKHNTILLQAKIKGCEQAAYLSWNAYINWKDGVTQYRIYRAKNAEKEILIDSTTFTSWKDISVDFHDSFTYRVAAVENNGKEISFSNTGKIQTIDPGTPEIFYATKQNSSANSGEILVRWETKNSSQFAAYRKLFYRANKNNSYKLLADSIPLKQDSFLHSGLNTRVGYHDYFMQTVDSCGNLSDSSGNHTPIDLTVKVGQLIHNLHWSPYKGWPKNAYVVQKWDGLKFYDLDTIKNNDTTLRKFPAPCNNDIFYRIKAVGSNGQVSFSDTMGGRAIDTIPANASTLQNVSILSGSTVRVDFIGADSLDIYAYAIQRGTSGNWNTAGQVLFTKAKDNYSFTDTTTTWKSQLCYTIITLDSCLNATSSDTFCTIQLHGLEKNLSNELSWQPFAGYEIDSYFVQHLTTGGWDTLAKVKGSDTSYLHTPLPCNVPVSYRIIGLKNGGYSTFSDSITLIPYDTIKPQAPVVNYISVLDKNSFEAHWQLSTDKDVKLYELQTRSMNGSWEKIDTLDRKTAYIISGKNALDSTYLFRVVAIDSCADNRSLPSVEHKTIQLKGAPKNLASQLNWSHYEGFTVKNYVVYSWRKNVWKPIDTIAGNRNSYLDTGLQCNVPFVYKVSALSGKNGFVSYSDTISIIPFDTIKPPAPKVNYATVIQNGQVQIYWQKSVPDVHLYEVSIDDGNGWKIKDTLYETLNYTFTGLNTPTGNYCLRVAAIDSCAENKSTYSEIHCPVQLDGKPANLANNLSWSAYKGFSPAKYYIYEFDKKWFKIDSVNGNKTSYTHDSLACNVPHIYKIGALDKTGKFLSFSDSVILTPFDTIKPKAPSLKYITVQTDRSIEIAWNWDKKSDVKYFEIWRNKDFGTWQKIHTVVYDSQFTDVNVQPQISSYKYYVIAVDSCNNLNRSAPSDTDRIMNVKLATGGCIPLVNVSWNAYYELPENVDFYEIQRSEDGLNFTTAGIVQANTTSFRDTLVKAGIAYQYKIKAVDSESGYSSYSDTSVTVPWIFPRADSNQIVYTSVLKTGITDGEILVKWKQYDYRLDSFARGYNLYRSTSPQGPYRKIFTTNNLADTAYIDSRKNASDSLHFYYLAVYNVCNIEGPGSATHQPVSLEITNKNLESALSWNAYKGAEVDYYEIYRSKNNNAYVKIATVGKSDTIFSDTNVQCKQVYSYQVFSYLRNGHISLSDTEFVHSFDTIPPKNPDIKAVSIDISHRLIGQVSVVFSGNKELNRSGYRIFGKAADGSFYPVEDMNFTNSDTFTWTEDPVNSTQSPFTYYVVALDSCGNISLPSDTHTTVFLKAKAQSMYIQLDWTNYIGFRKGSNYKIQRKKAGEDWTEIATIPATVLSLRDSAVDCNIYYTYRILTEETGGAQSYSNLAGDTAFETELPFAPELKYVTVNNTNQIAVNWKPSPSKDISGYHVYRSENDGASWDMIAYNVKDTAYTDKAINAFNTVYRYKTEALDSCGNVSATHSPEHGTIKLRATGGNSEVNVSWNAYLGWMPDGYKIYRDGILLAEVSGNVLNFTDTNVLCINTYLYKAMAYNYQADSLFSWSNEDSARPYDHKKPAPVYLQTATVSLPNKKVTLHWEPCASWDVNGYRIWRRNGNTGFYELLDSTSLTTYTDSFANINASHCYFIEAYDYCQNRSEWSNSGCIMVLFGESKAGKNILNWNPYKQWLNGISTYNIYRNDDSAGWRNIGNTQNLLYEDIAFADTTVEKFCYKVEAIESGTGTRSFSTITCLQQEPVVYIPNAFTPGFTEGLNDRFLPYGLYIKSYKMQIYNRWGQLVFESNNSAGWDGKYRGQFMPDGLYLYRIEVEGFSGEQKQFNGSVNLLR